MFDRYIAGSALAMVSWLAGSQAPGAEATRPASRPAPPATATVIDVAKYGAVPDDEGDDTAAVLAAIEECRKHRPAVLRFVGGRYRFSANARPDRPLNLFSISDLDSLTVDGHGSEFIVDGVIGLFSFTNCNGLVIKDLAIDWKRPPFSVGQVMSVNGRDFDAKVDQEFPVRGGEGIDAFMDYDPQTRLPMRQGLDEYGTVASTERVGEQVLRVHLKHQARIKPGVLVVLRHEVYGHNALSLVRCRDAALQDVTVYTAPGFGLVGSRCENVSLTRFRVLIRKGTARLMSTTADATHFGGCKGLIRMEGCEFEGMGDDATNIKSGLYLIVKETPNDHTVLGTHPMERIWAPEPGESWELSHADTLLPYATVKVKRSEVVDKGLCRVTLAEPLPAELKETDLMANATRVPRVRITHCAVRNNRARGFLIQTRDVVVENCRFENCTSAGIYVFTDANYFYESIGTRDVVIRNNTFENCNYGAAMGPGALAVFARMANRGMPQVPGVHQNVTLEGNVIRGSDNAGIFVAGTIGVHIRGNTIEKACNAPTQDQGRAGIYVMSSRDVEIQGNTVIPDRQGPGCKSAVEIGPGCPEGTAKVADNTGF